MADQGLYWAFVDEFGTANLDTMLDEVGTLFIVTIVVVPEENLATVRAATDQVKKKHFQGTMEVKSNKWLKKSSPGVWERVIQDIAKLDFKFYALAVDKRELDKNSGFQWKTSFYKNLCGRAYGKLIQGFPGLNIRADKYGRTEFKESFGRYIEKNHRPTLFEGGDFDWAADDEPLTQLADILCGLLARCYDPAKPMDRAVEILSLLKDRALLIDEWPVRFRFSRVDGLRRDGEDPRITAYSITKAEDFVQQNQGDKMLERRCQVAVLERLLLLQRFGSPGESINADALHHHLEILGLRPKATQWVRHDVIAPMRDAGVLITSSPKGYRLPTSAEDFEVFARHAESVCLPMLKRVNEACRAAKLVSTGDIDVLSDPAFSSLAALVGATGHAPDD